MAKNGSLPEAMGVRPMVDEVPSGRVVWMEKPRWPGGPVLVSGGSMVRTADGVSRCWPSVVKRPGMSEGGRRGDGVVVGGTGEDGSFWVEGDGRRFLRESGWARPAQRRRMEMSLPLLHSWLASSLV